MSPPFKLSLQGRSFPAHYGNSSSSSSQTVDWLPDYHGYSWIAYGSFSSLVISLAPVPTRKDEEADLEICYIMDCLHDIPITCVLWDPSCSGFLASCAGNCVCIYGPQFSDCAAESEFSVFPRAWLLKYKLEHAFQVYSFAWTESGDGLLVVGTEVVMWMQNEGWCKLWKSYVNRPQFSAAATFSAKGLAATADGDFVNLNDTQKHGHKTPRKGEVTVWWWEDNVGLLEAELIHPQEVVMIQWRPSKTYALQKTFRSVLLTTCKDGAVRLWIEMDNGRSRLERALGKDVPLKNLKPSFFVGAVIEAEQYLCGNLGKEILVSWPLECIAPWNSTSGLDSNSVVNTISKRENTVSCEWLIGLGPEGSICIWGVFYIDEINPSRCPRVFLWKKSSPVLSASQPSVGMPVSQMLMKVFAQRLGKKWGDPPSFLDLFYAAHPMSFHWFRIWLPVSSISGNDCRESVVLKLTTMSAINKTDAWGMVSEQLHVDSHSHNVISLAVHPITHIGLIATLDSCGHIFFWKIPSFSSLINMDSATCFSRWRPSGHFIVPSNSKTITWLPALFPKDQTILLLVHAGSIDCYTVLEKSTTAGFSLLLNLIYRIEMFGESSQQNLCDIWAIPMQNHERSASAAMNFTILGQGQTSHEILCCDLGIGLREAEYCTRDIDARDQVSSQDDLVVHLFGITNLKQPEHVSCLAVVPAIFLPFIEASTNCLMFESLAFGSPYNFATGSSDGTVRLWKRSDQEVSIRKVGREDNNWVCIGVLNSRSGPVNMMSIGNFGLKIATAGPVTHGHEIEIWNLESCVDIAYFNLNSRILLDSCPISVQWLQAGNGQSMLGILTETELQVYAEAKVKEAYTITGKWRKIPWFHVASVSLFSSSPCFSWGPKGSLLLPIRDHILIYGPKLILEEDKTNSYLEPMIRHYTAQLMGLWHKGWDLLEAGNILNSSLPLYHPTSLLYLLYSGNHQQARVCLSYLLQNLPKLSTSIAREDNFNSHQLFFPIHLKEFFQTETGKAGKLSTEGHRNKVNWGSDLDHELEYQGANLNRLHLSDEVNGTSAHNMDEVSSMENLGTYLHNFYLYGLNEDEKNDLLTVASVLRKLDVVSKAIEYQSLDLPGKRFWVSVQLSHSKQCRRYGRNARVEELMLDSKSTAWALQSDCKGSLLDICLADELSWPSMQALGIGFWLTNIGQLRTLMEKLARVQYLSEKDPKSCTLLYLALQRKNVLTSLFKLSRDEKDKVLYEFLTRDFQEEKNQAAALKNAYVLMGKHRHHLAAAFFLLGGDLSSAVSVCAKNLGDLQLAFVICRLVEGINGETEGRLIKDYALPNAHSTGDCWLACTFQWLVGEKFKALEELAGKLKVSEVSGFRDMQGNKKNFSLVFQDRSGLIMLDPDVWHFCHLLATKCNVESSLSSSAMALRRWIMCKTSIALEKLGLPVQALEHLHLIPLSNETTVECIESPNLKWLTLNDIQDKFPVELQALDSNIIFLGADIFERMKVNLALQYQAQLVQAHPGWKFNGLIEHILVLDNVRDSKSIPGGSLSHDLVVQSNEKLIQNLHIFARRYSINAECMVAELAKFVSDQNSLYLQCFFIKGILDEENIRKQLIMEKPSFLILNDLLWKRSKDLLKVIVYVGLICRWDMIRSSFLPRKTDRTDESSVDLVEIMHLTSNIRFLSMDNEGKGEAELEVIVLLILCSICSWQQCDWNAVEVLTKLIKSREPSLSLVAVEIDALLKMSFRTYSSNFVIHKKISLACPASDYSSGLEKGHILALAFWDAFFLWAKKQLSEYNLSKSSPENTLTSPDRTLSGIDTHPAEYIRVVASISSFFQKKLVMYLNSSNSVSSGYLHSWLWGSRTPIEGISPQESSEHNISMMRHEGIPNDQDFDSVDHYVDKIWKEVVVHNHIKSVLELGGVKQYSYFTSKGSSGSNAKSNAVTRSEERILENGMHDKSVDVGVSGENRISGHSAYSSKFKNGEEVLYSSGDLFEAFCVNSCCPEQVVIASSKKGLIFLDLNTRNSFSTTENGLWGQVEWPQNGWAKSESTPLPTFVSPGVGLASKEGRSLGLGGSAVGLGALTAVGTESSFKGAGVGIPGYGGMGALGLGWDDWEDFDGVVDPLATLQNVNTQAMDSHPLRPLFLVGSRNTHVYLWEFGKSSATATYGILPAANISPPYAVASISAVRFDHSGHRFASSAIDGTLCTWQLEVGGRSNVRPTESYQCFTRHASDVALLGASGAIVAATGASENDFNLVFWDTLAPSATSRASVFCHEGGARCLEMFDRHVGGGSFSPLVVTCGKSGDIALHDFRYIATGKSKRHKSSNHETFPHGEQSSKKQRDGELNLNGMVWYLPKAHSGSITCVSAVPGTSLFLTGSKDGDVKLWDANKCEIINHWPKVHEKHMFLQHNARGFGAVVQAAVTDVHPVSSGFVTSGGDGSLKLFSRLQ